MILKIKQMKEIISKSYLNETSLLLVFFVQTLISSAIVNITLGWMIMKMNDIIDVEKAKTRIKQSIKK